MVDDATIGHFLERFISEGRKIRKPRSIRWKGHRFEEKLHDLKFDESCSIETGPSTWPFPGFAPLAVSQILLLSQIYQKKRKKKGRTPGHGV